MTHRVLVTGGAGFIGSHLCEKLVAAGNEVLCLDNFFTGRKENIQHLLKGPSFEVIRHDVVEPVFLEVDRIYNLACPASPVQYQSNPVKTIKANVLGTLHVLGLAKRVGARVLQASTSEVYGDPGVHPQTEDYRGNVNPIGPRACYDEGKRVAETLCFDYHRQNHVDIRIARIFNTYGPRMLEDDGRVVSNFVLRALRDKPLAVYGDGRQTRSFCYVDDIVEGMMRLMEVDADAPVVNLGNPDELAIADLAARVIAQVGSNSRLAFAALPIDDPRHRQPDISRAKALLDWQPTVDLYKGLAPTIDYFRRRLAA